MRVVAVALVLGACSPAVALAPPATRAKPAPPVAPSTSCVAKDVDALVAAGKLRRALSTLDAWRCPGGEHLVWAPRVKILAKLGRVDEARALIAKIDATPWATNEMRLAARAAEKEPAPSKSGDELVTEALASKNQALVDRAIDVLERSSGARLSLDLPTRERHPPRAIAFSPAGDRFAVAHAGFIDVSAAPSWAVVARLPVAEPPLGITFTADGSALVAASSAHLFVSSLDGKPLRTIDASAPIGRSSKGVWARKGDALVVFDEKTWTPGKPIEAGRAFEHAVLSFDEARAAFSKGGAVELVDVASGKRRDADMGQGYEEPVSSLAFSPNGAILAVGTAYGSQDLPRGDLLFVDVKTGDRQDLLYAQREVVALAFSPDGKKIASTGSLTTRVWDVDSTGKGRIDRKFAGRDDATLAVAFHPSSRLLASTSKDGSTNVWSLDTDKDRVKELKAGNADASDIAMAEMLNPTVSSPVHAWAVAIEPATTAALSLAKGGMLAVGAGPEALYTFSFDGKGPVRIAHPNAYAKSPQIVSTAFGPTGALAYGSNDAHLRILGGKRIAATFRVEQLAFAEPGVVAAITADGSYQSFTLPDTPKDVHSPGKFARRALALSSDGKRYVARATQGKTVMVVDGASGKLLKSLDDVEPFLTAIAVSNDGNFVLAAKGSSVRLHGAGVTVTARGAVHTVAFDATTKLFAVGDDEGFAWFGIDGKQLGRIATDDAVQSVGFTDDRLVAASSDGTVSIVSMKTHARLLRAGVGAKGGFLQNGRGQALLFGAMKESAVCRVGVQVFPLELCAEELLVERVELE